MRSHSLFAVILLPSLLLAAPPENVSQASSVQHRIDTAQKRTDSNPKSWQSYNDLAAAICRKGRDHQDVALYDQAETALQHSFRLSPGNYEAEKLEVVVLLGKHEFSQALKLAAELTGKMPDDIGAWGLLVDTNVALGNYSEAERAAQWILDLRPGSSLGFLKAAAMRELFGDAEGAIEFFDEANRRTSQNDADERAWLLTQNARLNLASGNAKRAEELLGQASKLFPDSQLALATLAALRTTEGNYDQAALLLEQRYRTVRSSANLYDWAQALEKSGRKDEALRAFQDFETKAQSEMTKAYNADLQLIFYYADQTKDAPKALELARRQSAVRHDSATLDAYAWALYQNGNYGEAKIQMERALAVGVRNPIYFSHAAQIAKASDTARAAGGVTR